ncbi:SDR family NAD(P)-dependent oxidoreductase [Paractinoplanes atraurantiacus]|uniref:Phosphopantetheine attachment site n=1 Tax=Paractinoplanes atraurantiacus TaxID=1036182 RepID=A0A285GLV7_9ACTN|nr:SDR family NAD(P)-dependent oxidoreductase [Actinoplanes atraurantiacus]SNY24435.1 Phosphopantetheine attachment site [Actinoplanes atraurantiacus]
MTSIEHVLLSAASRARLHTYAGRLRDHLSGPAAPASLADVAHTLQTGRTPMAHRLAVSAAETAVVVEGLDAFLAGRPHPAVRTGVAEEPVAGPDPASAEGAVTAWLGGQDVDWRQYRTEPARRVSLPTYPWSDAEPPAPRPSAPSASSVAERYLVGLYAEVSGIPVAQLTPHTPLTDLGLSSFLVTRLNARLEQDLGETDRTLFFAHSDLAGVAAVLAGRWSFPAADANPAEVLSPAPIAAPAPAPSAGPDDGAVAVIGLAGRYPRAAGLDEFWANLVAGRDCVSRIPAARTRPGWPADDMWGGFLDEVDRFDPLLFGITPRDADLMDPQERLFLEVVWEAMEDAGYTRARLRDRHGSRVAVYAGAMHNEYPYFGVESSRPGHRVDSGATLGGIANRVSFFLDLHGPSLSVDTMCSSSLTALHLAVRALRAGESEVAIAGGVNLSLHPNKFVQQRRMRLVASDHRCRSFGEGGDGFVSAEGAGVVLLKPLARALADGDRVHAIVRGSAVVHAGRTNGYLVPNPEAQGDMVRRALRDAEVDPATIGYIEAHGAGTALGDPVEINGLLRAFGEARLAPGTVPIGSVKSVIGHVEAAAGIAGLTKVILQMRNGRYAPTLHAERLNPNVDWASVPFRVQREAAPWPSGATPRRAAISSFGAGGTIAHVVVEEAPAVAAAPAAVPGPRLIVLTAYDEERLHEVVARLVAHLRTARPALADVAYTLQVGREHLRERLALVVNDIDELGERLAAYLAGRAGDTVVRDRAPSAGHAENDPPDGAGPVELARHWAAGGRVDWAALPGGGRVIALPSYPFARMRCWLPGEDPEIPLDPEVPLYSRAWQAAGTIGEPATMGPAICVFSAHSEAVARALAAQGPVVLVREGGELQDGIAGFVTEKDAAALAETLLRDNPAIDGWLDLADLYRPDAERGLWSARLAMLRTVVTARAPGGLRALQVTDGLRAGVEPGGTEPGRLAGARVAGFLRVLGAEYRSLRAGVLDTDVSAGDPHRLAGHILAEWAAPEPEVCHRGGQRFRPVLRPLDAPYEPLRVDPAAAYVVTGATRGLGALVTKLLADRGARRLAVLGYRGGPALDQAVTDLECRGVRVLPYAGALTDRAALGAFLDRVRDELGAIGGIVHCAGRSAPEPTGFAYQDPAVVRDVLEPKVDGLEALLELTAGDRPAFTLLFSSVCAAVPSVAGGVTDYAAANAFLDLTAAQRAADGVRSVNWPQWRESGGGRDRPNPCLRVGLDTLDDEAGLRVLERVLARPAGGVVLPAPPLNGATVDLDALLTLTSSPAETSAPPVVSAPPSLDRSLASPAASPPATPAASPAAEPPAWLRELFADALRLPAADLDDTADFSDLGVESIMLGELLLAIEARLGRSLEPAALLDHPTLARLSAHLGVNETPAPPQPEAPARPASPAASPPAPPDGRVAVIGMACRFPGAPDTDTFWDTLIASRCAVDEVPASRWDHRRFYRPQPGLGHSISKWGGFVTGLEDFDPAYFGLGDEEATCLDPAIRMFLEGTATCLRDAGYSDEEIGGREVGVFVGARMSEYGRRVGVRPGVLRSDQNFIAAHVAHHFDLRGPNLVIDSACSSSLVSVQLAIRSLLAGESAMALAGGVEVLLDEQPYLDLSAARALSPTGRCYAFDERADGFVPGEGCGVVLLKPLERAIADGDRIHAVIEAVAVNNDGRTMGMTTPNPAAQARVVRRALDLSGRSPDEIGMVEAHGTATLIGDPIELRALTDVYGAGPARAGGCPIGSVKSNIGHLLSAAGIAGLAKVILSVRHGQIPATLFCETPNPRFDFARSPFTPNTALRQWPELPAARVAALSSFGLGGTNAHLIASGFDLKQRYGHPDARRPLPPPRFARRRLWLDPPGSAPAEEPEPLLASILDLDLSGGSRPALPFAR